MRSSFFCARIDRRHSASLDDMPIMNCVSSSSLVRLEQQKSTKHYERDEMK